MYATQKRALTEARRYERAPASVGSAASTFQQMAGQAGNQAMLAHLGQHSEPAATGESLPNAIMQRFERKSGVPLDDVRVHYNSDKPDKFDAEAYARGNEIFIGPGNERDLEHEVGHVVQQKMGQVRPTGIEHGFAVNRSPALEHGADVGAIPQAVGAAAAPVVQCRRKNPFTNSKFKGASINNKGGSETVGSLYFGGSSSDEYSKGEWEEMTNTIDEYLRAKENLEEAENYVHELEEKVCAFLINAKSGGRIRIAHDHGPKISSHDHILRINVGGEGNEGRLLEIFGDIFTDEEGGQRMKINTYRSRGAFIKTDDKDIVKNIGEFSDKQPSFFSSLAGRANTAQIYHENIGKPKKAFQANKLLFDSLTEEEKQILLMN